MTVGLQTRHSLPAPLRLFVALIAMVVGIAAGATTGVAETGVAANNFESAAAVEADVNIPAGHVGSNTVVFDDWSSACCVAPQTTPDLVTTRPGFSPTANRGGVPGSRPGEGFTPAGKDEVLQRQAAASPDGIATCPGCDVQLTTPLRSERGVTPPVTDAQVDHIDPRWNGGSGDPSNGQGLCRTCNRGKWMDVP